MAVLVIHGGAGTIERGELSEEMRQRIHQGLREALLEGYKHLTSTQSKDNSETAALQAATAAVRVLEDNPLFNAGRGSVFNVDGKIEMEASVMDGRERRAGACTLLQHVRNPIDLAVKIMQSNDAIMLAYPEAEKFATQSQLPLMPADYFYTEHRWQQHLRGLPGRGVMPSETQKFPDVKGTVGAVALDGAGNLASATSTGGRNNKPSQRIGDTPLIGCGTFADNNSCAVSCTGHGEYFIRQLAAADIHARLSYGKQGLMSACRDCLKQLGGRGGSGGVIAVDKNGNFAMPMNSSGMYRGYISLTDGGQPHTFIFSDEYQGENNVGVRKKWREIIVPLAVSVALFVKLLISLKNSQ